VRRNATFLSNVILFRRKVFVRLQWKLHNLLESNDGVINTASSFENL